MLKSPWVIAGIIIVVVALLAWLFVRLGKRMMTWFHEPVEPGKPRWTYALTPLAAALAPLAAFSALLPSYLSQQQSDKKFMMEAKSSRTDATWQRIRLDSDTQTAHYIEVQSRFGSADAKTRAVAALQLADIAVQQKASATGNGDTLDESGYPHFLATGTQLALALQMEENADVRAADRQALGKLFAVARAGGKAGWQIALTNRLADTNRRAARSFTEALGRYAAVSDVREPSVLQALASVAPFTPVPNDTLLGLRDLTTTDGFRADRRVAGRLRAALPDNLRRTSDAAHLAMVQAKAQHLIDTRDALADALRTLKPGGAAAAPALPKLSALPLLPQTTSRETPKESLQLRNCYLAGANLWEASLVGADVTGANFTGANLKHSRLTGANLLAAVRLSPSVTRADQGPGKEQLPALKKKYPNYDWAAVEARLAATAKAPTKTATLTENAAAGAAAR